MASKQRGRPRGTILDQLMRVAAGANRDYNHALVKVQERLAVDPDTDESEAKEVHMAAENRMRVAEQLYLCQLRLCSIRRQMRKGLRLVTGKEERELDESIAAERAVWAEYSILPDLGFSEKSWAALPAEFRKRPPGKPRTEVDLKLAQAKHRLQIAVAALREEESKAGIKPVAIADLPDPQRMLTMGRPRLDRLGVMDKRMHRLELTIDEIQAEPYDPTRQRKAMVGRPRKTKKARIDDCRSKIATLKLAIDELEAHLMPSERPVRLIKKLRNERHNLRRRAGNSPTDLQAKRLVELDHDIAALLRVTKNGSLSAPEARTTEAGQLQSACC
jgi:hypothetical protein